jgi:hypothetical protein
MSSQRDPARSPTIPKAGGLAAATRRRLVSRTLPCRPPIVMPRPHRSSVSCGLVLVLFAGGLAFSAQPAAPRLLPETVLLDRIDGKLICVDPNEVSPTRSFAFGCPDTWAFELTAPAETPDVRLPAGRRFVLLPSATLGRLIADVNERSAPRYRLWARVTRFREDNYLFPTYYLPLSKFKDEEGPDSEEQKTQDGAVNQESKIKDQKSEDSELTIPPEVLEQLKNQSLPRGRRGRTEAGQKPSPSTPDRVLVDCTGRIGAGEVEKWKGGNVDASAGGRFQASTLPRFHFVPYALGWGLSDIRYELLPCAALEEALRRQKQALEPMRFNVAGLVTEFHGKKYLLLQRAVVVYNYGNFGR